MRNVAAALRMTVHEGDIAWLSGHRTALRGAAFSGDGKTVVAAAQREGKRAVAMPGGEVRQLTAGFFGAVSVAPVGDRYAAVPLGGADDDELRLGTR